MTNTPLTDNLARGNHVVPTEFAQDLERERDEARAEQYALEEERSDMRMEIARLMDEVERLEANAIHSCSPYCQRPACIARRERDEAIAARKTSAADWLNQVEQANARVSRALQQPRDFAIREMDRLEEERDQARNLGDAAMWEADRLYGQLWRARDRAWKLARERNHWKADCLEQCRLLAMGADREEKLLHQVAALKSQISNLKSP